MTEQPVDSNGIDWASTAVAIALLTVIGLVLRIAASRYSEGDLEKVIGSLGPLLGVVSGAFVTYFFTRPTVKAGSRAIANYAAMADRAAKADSAAQTAQKEAAQKAELAHAATMAFDAVWAKHDKTTQEQIRKDSQPVASFLDPVHLMQ